MSAKADEKGISQTLVDFVKLMCERRGIVFDPDLRKTARKFGYICRKQKDVEKWILTEWTNRLYRFKPPEKPVPPKETKRNMIPERLTPDRRRWLTSREFLLSSEWRKVRYEAFKRSRGRCVLCGVDAKGGAILHADHIKPRSKFPEFAVNVLNLQILCADCNIGKSNTDDTDWRKSL